MEPIIVKHYGTPRKSGRYEWGSGKDPQRNNNIYSQIEEVKAKGYKTEKEIATALGLTTTQLRAKKSEETARAKEELTLEIGRLKDSGMSNAQISSSLGIAESTLRGYTNPVERVKNKQINGVKNELEAMVGESKYLDVGAGSEIYMNISRDRLNKAVKLLTDGEDAAYEIKYLKVEQLGTQPGNKTTIKVLTEKGVKTSDIYADIDQVKYPNARSQDNGVSFSKMKKPEHVDLDKVGIVYSENGGSDRDGLMLIRRGAEGMDLGNSRYAQVRIAAGDNLYLKGMAMYDNEGVIPKGQDVLFYTNKTSGTPKEKVLKTMKDVETNDPSKAFGSSISRQEGYLNIVNEEGGWSQWSSKFSSQFLSKQNPSLVKKQLEETLDKKQKELDEINDLTNPTVKRKLLLDASESYDAAAVNLKAVGLPRTATHVLLPYPELKDNEVYAPNYKDGERVVLVRHPHAGTFEIPDLVVNNKVKSVKDSLGQAQDAIGVNKKTLNKLSGADCDGDSVLVIPNDSGKVKTSPSLKGLVDFDPQSAYPGYTGMKKMTERVKGIEMGKISNLITDMSVLNASSDEMARAVRHSMVVIDAYKHELNYRKSAEDNAITALKQKYQGGGGSATLLSRSSGEVRINDRKQVGIDTKTGKKIWEDKGDTYIKDGVEVVRQQKVAKMTLADDAHTLTSGRSNVESLYADYANGVKSLGDQARLSYVNTPPLKYSPEAKKTYQSEVESLNNKLIESKKNAPLERQAQVLANIQYKAIVEANPDMSDDQKKKAKGQVLTYSRATVGASKYRVEITEREWEAIQAGAISNSKLESILNNANMDRVKQLATPRETSSVSPAQESRARSMLNSGRTYSEIAEALGVSTSTVRNMIVD